jgi:hypothetical protein
MALTAEQKAAAAKRQALANKRTEAAKRGKSTEEANKDNKAKALEKEQAKQNAAKKAADEARKTPAQRRTDTANARKASADKAKKTADANKSARSAEYSKAKELANNAKSTTASKAVVENVKSAAKDARGPLSKALRGAGRVVDGALKRAGPIGFMASTPSTIEALHKNVPPHNPKVDDSRIKKNDDDRVEYTRKYAALRNSGMSAAKAKRLMETDKPPKVSRGKRLPVRSSSQNKPREVKVR